LGYGRFCRGIACGKNPQQQKQRHHGGDKVGIGNLPCAAVMTAVALFDLFDDN
jgi:hypothetical protein